MKSTEFPEGDFRAPVPVVGPGQGYGSITDKLTSIVFTTYTPKAWFAFMGVGFMLVLGLLLALTWLLLKGIGIWGNNIPVGWAFDITNFVWWIGIGHAGTLISAILFLFRQRWRTAINRFSEAMTIFAVMCAGVFPAFHVGRVWVVYYIFPLPNQMSAWPNTRSPLFWDVFAVSTYFTVSLVFWFVGLIR